MMHFYPLSVVIRMFPGVMEGLTQQKLQILSDQHCCQSRTVVVFLSYFTVEFCINLNLNQLILFYLVFN